MKPPDLYIIYLSTNDHFLLHDFSTRWQPSTPVERGIAAYKSGDYAMAGQKVKFVLAEHPNNLTALYC